MANSCKYVQNGEVHQGFDSLLNAVKDKGIADIKDSVISQNSEQACILDKFKEIQIQRIIDSKAEQSFSVDNTPDFATEKNIYTTQTLIDSPLFVVNGKRPIQSLNFDEYINNVAATKVENMELREEDVQTWADNIHNRWETISDNATQFHELMLLPQAHDMTTYQWGSKTNNTAFAAITNKVIAAEQELYKQVMYYNGKRSDGSRSILLRNRNFESKIIGQPDNVKLLGHIDYLVVTPDGMIDVYNIKTSTEPYSQWSRAKKEKYKYQMALIKQMLASYGFNPKNIRLHIIPVQLKYDANFEKITDINVQKEHSIDYIDGIYKFDHYDNIASNFIESKANFSQVSIEDLDTVSSELAIIFPGKHIMATGITKSAEEWVDANWNYIATQIDEGSWQITLPSYLGKEQFIVHDARVGRRNKAIVDHIQALMDKSMEAFTGDVSATGVLRVLKEAFNRGWLDNNLRRLSTYIEPIFSKYFNSYHLTDDGSRKIFDWELIENPVLEAANIVAFRHKNTGQLDIYTLTSINTRIKYKFNNQNNILGAYVTDMNSASLISTDCSYGNIEAIRTIVLLNEVLPKLGCNVKLGQVSVLGISTMSGKEYTGADLVKIWNNIIEVVNKNNKEANLINNFSKHNIQCIDALEILKQEFESTIQDNSLKDLTEIVNLYNILKGEQVVDGTVFKGVENANDSARKIQMLNSLYNQIEQLLNDTGARTDPESLMRLINDSSNKNRQILARLLIATSKALSTYYGDTTLVNSDFSGFDEYFRMPQHRSNEYVTKVASILRETNTSIRNTVAETFIENVYNLFTKFYKDSGYSRVENMLIGDQAKVFKNLYKLDKNGNNTLLFKNPYDPNSDLTNVERAFLKSFLYQLYKLKCQTLNKVCDIKGENDEKLLTEMPDIYLWVPLQKATNATRISNGGYFKQLKERIIRVVSHPLEALEEDFGLFGEDEAKYRDATLKTTRKYNHYRSSLLNDTIRQNLIQKWGVKYYETNLQNIFLDMLDAQTKCDQYRNLLIRINAMELQLRMRGQIEGSATDVDSTIKNIQDYIVYNVHNKPIMSRSSQRIDSYIGRIRKLASYILFGGNFRGTVRDTTIGFTNTFLRAALKLHTNLNLNDITFGYYQVIREGVNDPMVLRKIDQFNVKFNLTSYNAADVSHILKSNRTGLLNMDNLAFWSMRAPDTFIRNVLFVANLHHDGAYNAYSLNSENKLVYNWRKDKRFSALASNDKSDPNYKKQLSLYASMIRAFNEQNPNLHLEYNDDLPDAYTPQEIERMKELASNIMGNYDKASRAKLEATLLGKTFCQFLTFANGIINTYFEGTHKSVIETTQKQATDSAGNLLYFTIEDVPQITTEDTGVPVLEDIPVVVQGVLQTYFDIAKRVFHGDAASIKSEVWTNDWQRANLKRSWSDMAIAALCYILYKAIFTPAYKRHKKEDSGDDIVTNLMLELLYKGTLASTTNFGGPIVFWRFALESTNPVAFNVDIQLLKNVYNMFFGGEDFWITLSRTQALFKNGQDAIMMYRRDNK